jgi:hypothetical protein
MFFLFNDVLLYGKPKLMDSGGGSYTCCCVLPIKHCQLERVFATGGKSAEASGGGGVFKVSQCYLASRRSQVRIPAVAVN